VFVFSADNAAYAVPTSIIDTTAQEIESLSIHAWGHVFSTEMNSPTLLMFHCTFYLRCIIY